MQERVKLCGFILFKMAFMDLSLYDVNLKFVNQLTYEIRKDE
jgi:hypothetical protein